jgi:hypothetical protein
VKLDNVLWSWQRARVVLVDFNSAKRIELRNSESIAADIEGCGRVLLRLCSGHFGGPTKSIEAALLSRVPNDWRAMLQHLLFALQPRRVLPNTDLATHISTSLELLPNTIAQCGPHGQPARFDQATS